MQIHIKQLFFTLALTVIVVPCSFGNQHINLQRDHPRSGKSIVTNPSKIDEHKSNVLHKDKGFNSNATLTTATVPLYTWFNSLAYKPGVEYSRRGPNDGADYFTNQITMHNQLNIERKWYIALSNQFKYGTGYYDITNNYQNANGSYPTTLTDYSGAITTGYIFFKKNYNISIASGLGYHYLYYESFFNKTMSQVFIKNVTLSYHELFIPFVIKGEFPISKLSKVTSKIILGYGFDGEMTHFVGENIVSRHNTYNIYADINYNYKRFSFGPWLSFNYYTQGYHPDGTPSPPANENLRMIAMGAAFSVRD